MKKKSIALLMACVLVFGVSVGGTMAWLTAETQDVVNTFTVGDINIEIKETTGVVEGTERKFDFVPGDMLAKDPKVSVLANSEACYLFVKVKAENNTQIGLDGNVIQWTVKDQGTEPNTNPEMGWVEYKAENVPEDTFYYRIVSETDAGTGVSWYVLEGEHDNDCADPAACDCENANGFVTVNSEIKKNMVDADGTGLEAMAPKLIFTAAAVQYDNIADENAAWAQLPNDFKGIQTQ